MASSAVYPTPSVGSAASWCWLPKSRLQEERYFKQLYQQKPPRDLGVQRNFNPQQINSHFEFGNHLRKYSHSPVGAPQKKQNLKSEIFARNSNQTSDVKNSSEVLRSDSPSKSLSVKDPQKIVANTSGSLNSGLICPTNFEVTESLDTPIKAKLSPTLESNQSSQKHSDSEVERSSKKSKLPHGWITNSLTCFLCQKSVRDIHFREHLFFGPLKCSNCDQSFKDCRSFQTLMVDVIMGKTSCEHSLEYCSDPFAFIGTMMFGERNYVPGSLFPSRVLRELSLYIGKMWSLENKDPWKAAIAQCKRHLPSFLVKASENLALKSRHGCKTKKPKVSNTTETSNVTPSEENNQRLTEYTSLTTHTPEKDQRISESGTYAVHNPENNLAGEKRLHERHNSERMPATFTLKKHGLSNHSNEEEDIGDLLLSQNYSLEQLEEAVEYIEVTGHCRTENSLTQKKESPPKIWKKKRFYKKRKMPKAQIDPEVPEEQKEDEDEFSTEYIETPADGYYYVVRHAIEECPMCYTVLCPSRFTVNVVTFLMTAVCSGCDLTIYIVPELPDGTTPGVSIVTEGATSKPKPLVKEKKKRGRRPKSTKSKKFLKTSKPQDFFCK